MPTHYRFKFNCTNKANDIYSTEIEIIESDQETKNNLIELIHKDTITATLSKDAIIKSSYVDATYSVTSGNKQRISLQLVFFNYLSNSLEKLSQPQEISEQDKIAAAAFKKITENKDFFGKLEAIVKKEHIQTQWRSKDYIKNSTEEKIIISDFLLEASRAFHAYYNAGSKLVEAEKYLGHIKDSDPKKNTQLAKNAAESKDNAKQCFESGDRIIQKLQQTYGVKIKRNEVPEISINPQKLPIQYIEDFLKLYTQQHNDNSQFIQLLKDNYTMTFMEIQQNTYTDTIPKLLNELEKFGKAKVKSYLDKPERGEAMKWYQHITSFFQKLVGKETTWAKKLEYQKIKQLVAPHSQHLIT
jgi:hypothetical protein